MARRSRRPGRTSSLSRVARISRRSASRGCASWGSEGVLSSDMRVPIWEKFTLLVPMSGLNALTRVPLGAFRDDPDLLALYEAALRETVAVGLAEGVRLPSDSVDKALATMWSMPS